MLLFSLSCADTIMSGSNPDNNNSGGVFFVNAVPIEGNRDATWRVSLFSLAGVPP